MVLESIQASLIYRCKRWGPTGCWAAVFLRRGRSSDECVEVCAFLPVFRRMWHMTADRGIWKSGPSCAISHWPVSSNSWTEQNQHLTTVSLVKAFTDSLQYPMEVVRSNLCLWGTQGRDLNLALSLPDPGYRSPSMEGSPQTHKPSPIPAQKLMSAGWNWPHSGCGQGADTKEADSAHSQIIFTVFPCWNSWEGCSGNGSSSIRSFSSSPVRSEQQRESGNSCTGGSGLGSSAGRISVGAVSGMLASPRATVTQLFHNSPHGLVSWGWSEACSYLMTSLNSSLAQLQIRLEEALKCWQICAYGLQDWPWPFRE